MSSKYQAWVSFAGDLPIDGGVTYTLREFIDVPVVVGTELVTGDGNGNLCDGMVTNIEQEIVQITLDPKSLRKEDTDGYPGS